MKNLEGELDKDPQENAAKMKTTKGGSGCKAAGVDTNDLCGKNKAFVWISMFLATLHGRLPAEQPRRFGSESGELSFYSFCRAARESLGRRAGTETPCQTLARSTRS